MLYNELPQWAKANLHNTMGWSFYDEKVSRVKKLRIESCMCDESLDIKFVEAEKKELEKMEYHSCNIGVALVEVKGRNQLYSFPVNKTRYFIHSIGRILNTEDIKLLNIGYFDYDTALAKRDGKTEVKHNEEK